MREKVQLKNQLCPCTLLEITKMSLVASMWHVPFVRSAKNGRQGPILLTVEKCRDFKNIY